ncbi:MAG TPA: hypothetical protein VFB70_03695, partial [Pyrinomonadaceae bacterium]|nr:hypothetical protein [Pyrinomonadaceae bacterium]
GAVSPKLKLGENEKPAVMITMCKGCHDNEQLRSNPGLELANAFGVTAGLKLANAFGIKS